MNTFVYNVGCSVCMYVVYVFVYAYVMIVYLVYLHRMAVMKLYGVVYIHMCICIHVDMSDVCGRMSE